METNDDLGVEVNVIFGRIELHCASPIIEGNDLLPRYRVIERDGTGKVTRDEVCDTGVRLVNGAPYAHLFR